MIIFNANSKIFTKMFGKEHKQEKPRNISFTYPEYHTILYFTFGTLLLKVDQETYQVNAGDIIVIPKNTTYTFLESKGITYYYFHFLGEINGEKTYDPSHIKMDSSPDEHNYCFYDLYINPLVRVETQTHCIENINVTNIIKKISSLNVWQNNRQKLLIDVLLKELLLTISSDIYTTNITNRYLAPILQYINDNYRKEITLTQLSEEFHISVSYIVKLFKSELNTSCVNYINQVRISAACELLLHTNLSIYEISTLVGFKRQHYFTHVFQKIYHTTPSAFRISGSRNQSVFDQETPK